MGHNLLSTTLERAERGEGLDRADLDLLLSLTRPEDLAALFASARRVRERFFGARVFLYGFVYFSTHCRNNCRFCHYRVSNTGLPRYRKTETEVLDAAERLVGAGVHLIDLTMGEDPSYYAGDPEPFLGLAALTAAIKARWDVPVMVSPGAAPDEALSALAEAGADWFACYQETYNRELFKRMRLGQDFDLRFQKKVTARQLGLLIEEGLLCGLGETLADAADSVWRMGELAADQVRVMTFIPPAGAPLTDSPLAAADPGDFARERVVIAVLRLAFPDRLIPASLDVDGLAGLKRRLDAGANVVTSLVMPGQGWAGVAHADLDIEDSRRTPAAVRSVLAERGLESATLSEYKAWLERRRRRLAPGADPEQHPRPPAGQRIHI